MRAYLIDPATRTISIVELNGESKEIATLLGAKNVDFDEIDDDGDRLYFDEDCFIKAKAGDARFKVDNLAPVSGAGLISGTESAAGVLQSANNDLAQITKRVQFL